MIIISLKNQHVKLSAEWKKERYQMSGENRETDDIKMKDALRLLAQLKRREGAEKDYGQSHVDQLLGSCNSFFETNKFKKGQLVKWKKGLKNKKLPYEKQPAVVLEVLQEPLYAERDPGTPYFHEPLDIALGMIDEDNDFIIFYYDSRRFEIDKA